MRILKPIHDQIKHQEIIAVAAVIAVLMLSIKLQLYIPLSRFQHYSLVLFVLGLGYVLQSIWSWRKLSYWSRNGYFTTGLYLGTIGIVLYANPWLDPTQAVQTEVQVNSRLLFACAYVVVTIFMCFVWINWLIDEYRARLKT